jgi:hypothetical protein
LERELEEQIIADPELKLFIVEAEQPLDGQYLAQN